MDELLIKQSEIIENLVWLLKKTLNLLSQYRSVEEYEDSEKRKGDDLRHKKNAIVSWLDNTYRYLWNVPEVD